VLNVGASRPIEDGVSLEDIRCRPGPAGSAGDSTRIDIVAQPQSNGTVDNTARLREQGRAMIPEREIANIERPAGHRVVARAALAGDRAPAIEHADADGATGLCDCAGRARGLTKIDIVRDRQRVGVDGQMTGAGVSQPKLLGSTVGVECRVVGGAVDVGNDAAGRNACIPVARVAPIGTHRTGPIGLCHGASRETKNRKAHGESEKGE